MPKYVVNVDTGFRVREGAPAIPHGTEFESDETPAITTAVEKGYLAVIKRRSKDAEPLPNLAELVFPETVGEIPEAIAGQPVVASVAEPVVTTTPPKPKRQAKKK